MQLKMKNKGQATSLSDVLIGLLVVGLIGMFVFLFLTRGQEIQVRVEENEILRRKLTLINVLISSDKLAYTTETMIHRGVIDKEKLDNLNSNPGLFTQISYPESGYSIKVVDLDEDNEWLVGKDFDMTFQTPVGIRYSEDNVHTGIISVEFNLDEIPGVIELDTCQKITDPGYYRLTTSLSEGDLLGGDAFGSKNCFEIEASGVILDCDHKRIEGEGSHRGMGIVVSGDNAIVKNCKIEGFANGINVDSSSSKILDNEIEKTNVGIILFKGNNEIRRNTIREPEGDKGRGIDVESGFNIIEGNQIFSALTNGIIIRYNENELIGNTVCDSAINDIYVDSGRTASGSGNTCDKTDNYDDDGVTGCEKECGEEPPEIPASRDRYVEKIKEVEAEIRMEYPDFPDSLLIGIGLTETNLRHFDSVTGRVIRGGSGEVGLMQIIPGTAGCSEDELLGWERNIECGGEVLITKYEAYYPLFDGATNEIHSTNYDPLGCGYHYTDPWQRAVRGYNGWGCPYEANKAYVCKVYDNARGENPSLPVPECP